MVLQLDLFFPFLLMSSSENYTFCMCRMVLDCSAMAVLILNDFSFLYVQSYVSKVAAML